jgi:hypothetical protein
MLRILAFVLPIVTASVVHATDVPPAMTLFIDEELVPWVHDARIVVAIKAQNVLTASLSQVEITKQDKAWRAEIGAAETPMIDQVLTTPLSEFLIDHVMTAEGRITEVFVMDGRGLNVAASAVTSDYWQGDEDKFQKSFDMGPGAFFIDGVEFDESTQTYQGQVSFAITDPSTGDVIGAITIGLNAGSFF